MYIQFLDWMRLRELDTNSIHWGGYSGMRLQVNPFDPLPNPLLGGQNVDDFLSHHLEHSSNPLASGLGLLVDVESSSSSIHSTAWSVKDPNNSFYEGVFDLIFSTPGPALPSDAIRTVPRLVEQIMITRGDQTHMMDSVSVDQVVQQVSF